MVHIGNKEEEKLPKDSQEADGLLSLGGSHSHAGLEVVSDSCPPPPFL
jgi:hypothetical protein